MSGKTNDNENRAGNSYADSNGSVCPVCGNEVPVDSVFVCCSGSCMMIYVRDDGDEMDI